MLTRGKGNGAKEAREWGQAGESKVSNKRRASSPQTRGHDHKVYCPSPSLIDILLYWYMYEYDLDIIMGGRGRGESTFK